MSRYQRSPAALSIDRDLKGDARVWHQQQSYDASAQDPIMFTTGADEGSGNLKLIESPCLRRFFKVFYISWQCWALIYWQPQKFHHPTAKKGFQELHLPLCVCVLVYVQARRQTPSYHLSYSGEKILLSHSVKAETFFFVTELYSMEMSWL